MFYSVASALRGEASDSYTLLYSRVAEHLRANFTDAYLLTGALLDALAPAGVVHMPQGDILGSNPAPQWRAMAAAWDHPACRDADWLAHLDPD